MNNGIIGTCGICHLAVNAVNDYAKLEDYIKGKIYSTGFYHRNCFREKMSGKAYLEKLQKKADWILNKAAEKVA